MENDSVKGRAKEIEGVDKDLPKIILVKDPNVQKTVPLASLSPATSKTPTPERVSALKAALAKAMEGKVASEKSQVASEDKTRTSVVSPTPSQPRLNEPQDQATQKVLQSPQQPQILQPAQLPKPPLELQQSVQPPQPSVMPEIHEVPEDVLRKTLKVE